MAFELGSIQQKKTERLDLNTLLKKEVRLWGSAFGNNRKETFYGELAVLLKAGVNLKNALTLVRDSQKKAKQQEYLNKILEALIAGGSFSASLQVHKEFTPYEYRSIEIGESSGTLPEVIAELGKFFERKNVQRRMLINALTYPMIILITAILVVIFMLRMVVPMFEDIFRQNDVELPAITKLIVAASGFIGNYGWLVVLTAILFIIIYRYNKDNTRFKTSRHNLLLRIPVLGTFLKTVYLAQFTQALALLTKSKVPILHGLKLAGEMISFIPLQNALRKVGEQVILGSSLHESLEGNSRIFDHKMITLVKVAEETNQTEFIFEKLHQQYHAEVEQRSKMLSTLLEPLIIVIVGIFVGVILVSMYLPMFKLSSVLG